MKYRSGVLWVCMCSLLAVCGERDLFQKKCKRDCATKYGTFDCWKTTTDGFAYGLATAMIDYCQLVLQLRQMADEQASWYNVSREILTKQIAAYEVNKKARQLSRQDTERLAVSLLDKCFHTPSSFSTRQPSCPSCSRQEAKLIKQWSFASIIPVSSALLFIFAIILLYAVRMHSSRRPYESISQ